MLHFKLKTRWCFTQTVLMSLMKSPRHDNYLTSNHHSHLAEIQLCKILSSKKMFFWNTILSWLHLGPATTSQWKCNMFCPRWNMKFLRHSTRIGPKGAKLSTMHTAWRQALPLESQPTKRILGTICNSFLRNPLDSQARLTLSFKIFAIKTKTKTFNCKHFAPVSGWLTSE